MHWFCEDGEDLCCHTNTWHLSSGVEPAVTKKKNPPVRGAFRVAVVQGCASSHHDTYPGNSGWHGTLHSCAEAASQSSGVPAGKALQSAVVSLQRVNCIGRDGE